MKNKNGILTNRPKYNHIKNYMEAKGLNTSILITRDILNIKTQINVKR